MQRLTQHEAETRASKAGVKLLEAYQGAHTKVLAECTTCKHRWEVWFVQLSQGGGCPKCYARSLTLTQAEANNRAQRAGVELLEPHQHTHNRIKVRCLTCGRVWRTWLGNGCRLCARRRNTAQTLSVREVARRAAAASSVLLDPVEYRNRSSKVEKQCVTCAHTWRGAVSSHCPACNNRKRFEAGILDAKEVARRTTQAGVRLLDPYRGTHVKAKTLCLTCGHEWKTTLDTISAGHRCPRCVAQQVRTLPEQEVVARAAKLHIELLEPYQRNDRLLAVRCQVCAHTWRALPNSIARGCGCPLCTRRSGVRESQVREIIEKLTRWKFPRSRPAFLRGRNGRPLELDGYNPRHQVAFEYQGEQHYRCVRDYDTPEKLIALKKRDERKRVLCYQHGVVLIRVPYWKRDVVGFVRVRLEKAGLL